MIIAGGCANKSSHVSGEFDYPVADKCIAFTFDDGPSAKTGRLLEVLKQNNIKATCFVTGQSARSRPNDLRMIFDEGHEIGNHSNDHAYLGTGGKMDMNAIQQNLAAAQDAIREITGSEPQLFRAPYLDYSENLTAVVRGMGMAIIGTDINTRDWDAAISTKQISADVLNSAKDGGIIILHEHYGGDTERTIRAIPEIAHELRMRGYEFVTVSEMARRKGVQFEAGKLYNIIR